MRSGRQLLTAGVTALAPAIWGSTYLVTTEWLPPDRPLLAATVRALPAGLILLAFARTLPAGIWLWRALVLGTLNIGAFNFLLFVAAYRLPGGTAAMIMSAQPMLVLVLAALFIGDRIRYAHVTACVLGAGGVVLLVSKGTAALDLVGVASALAGVACMAVGITLTKLWGRPDGVGLLPFTAWQLIAGGLVLSPFTLAVEGLPATISGANLIGFGYLMSLGAVISYAIWFRGIERLPALAVSVLALCSPIVATLLGYLFLHQTLSMPQLAGVLVIIGAALLAQLRPVNPLHTHMREKKLTAHDNHPHSTLRSWLGVAVITASLFVFVTTELMPVGLLTPVSSSLSVSVGVAGLMVTLYGVSAGLGVPFIVAWTRRVNRRALLSALLAILALGNLVTAVSPNYPLVLTARLLMGFANGVFWAIGVGMAMRLVPERHANRASAIALSGISIATVVGIPLGTFLESLTSWRTTFLIWSGLSALVFLAVATVIPSLPSQNAVPVREVFGLPRTNVRLRLVMFAVILYVLGHFGAYTFVRPFMEDNSAATPAFIASLLIIYGVGGAAGNFIAGYTVNKSLRGSFIAACAGLVVSLLLLLTIGHSQVGAIVSLALWGVSFGAANLCQINMTLAAAPDTFEAAMSINTLGYNTSIALGALFGGLFADRLGVPSAVWFGVALTAASLLLTLSTGRKTSRTVPDRELTTSR
ncbi:MFS transporter [Nonomuraea helvata]|uniref:MFS transporter n=1 Tax=Nonomuraea helvata TaxID=37484 RepID=A0ABV5RVZ7_9ACTN